MTETALATAQTTIDPAVRIANTDEIARQANAVTAIYGLTGAGKSALADTACEYCWETFHKVTLCYANDPGGFGNKRLSLIRLGIMRVWDPTNHVNPFETMEHMSLGAWPETIADRDRGYADPAVRLIMPRRLGFSLICAQGHIAASFENEAIMNGSNVPCKTCGVITNISNCLRVDRVIIKSKLFADVGLRIYDSVTGMNDRGLIIELPLMSAKGTLESSSTGGAALGSADALRQGTVVYGTGSKSQVGFMQNRSYQWLVNIRSIPDQVVPAIAIFGVEQSKVDDESGGEMLLGPKISGNARTSAVGGWVGNLCHASKEPLDGATIDPTTGAPAMVHRLWLVNHIDPRRHDRIPYIAKHRGTPLGMPDYLQDAWDPDPVKRAANAWTTCSLSYFFKLLETQFAAVHAADKAKFPDAPGLGPSTAEDEIIPIAAGAIVVGTTISVSGQSVAEAAVASGQAVVSGGRTLRSRRAVATAMPIAPAPAAPVVAAPVTPPAAAVQAATPPAPPASTSTPAVSARPAVEAAPADSATGNVAVPGAASPATVEPVVAETPQVFKEQLAASAVARGVIDPSSAQHAGAEIFESIAAVQSVHAAGAVAGSQPAAVPIVAATTTSTPAPVTPLTSAPASIAPAASTGPRVVRRPRPPV